MEFSPEAKAVAQEWYTREWYKTRDVNTDGYFSRKHDTMFKIATLLSISESSTRIIGASHIKRALCMLEENEKFMEAIVASVMASAVGDVTEHILETIRRAGKISHAELLKKSWREADSQTMSMMVKTLIEGGEIEEVVTSDNKTRLYKIKGRI
jgi:hypothetical protein